MSAIRRSESTPPKSRSISKNRISDLSVAKGERTVSETSQPDLRKIAVELIDLFDRQLKSIFNRTFEDLSPFELAAYRQRDLRILELRSTLDALCKGKRTPRLI